MRVLLTTDTIGGVWTFTKELTQQLLHRGHAVALVSFGREASREQQAWRSRIVAAHPATFLYRESSIPLEWMENNRAVHEDGADILLETARHFAPDILHSNQYCFGKLSLCIPKLITAHSDVLSWARACRPQGLESSLWLDNYNALVQQGLANVDAVIAPTRWMLQALSQHFNISCRTAVVPNGRTLSRTPQITPRLLQAVSVGRLWDEAKGLSALSSIASPIPLLLAGEAHFGTTTTRLSLDNTIALGPLSEEELLSLFRKSSIYLATSLYEPFGLAPLEAALCGCAVVARDLPSFREVWGNAAHYFTDAPSLERLLHNLWVNPATLHAAQAAAMRRASTYTGSRMMNSYLTLYNQLLQNDAASATVACKEEFASNAA